MSTEVARYQFHAWARKGIAGTITEKDDLGEGTSTLTERARISLPVTLNGAGLTKAFSLVGPGDIMGVNRDMIIRTEPLNWITDFEPNYLAFAEFYDEDFVWRYTPAAPDGEKLRPWLFLLVLKADEFERTQRRTPLPSINITGSNAFPPATETWLWAHVHSNAHIPAAELSDYEEFLRSLNNTMNNDPDQLYCRLMSPRKLESNTAYYAFIVPAFETGRMAGLEAPTTTINAQLPSWDANGARGEMPVYYEWQFHTGANADFESLVKRLEPRAMDPRVGIRDMDCSRPGFVRASDPLLEFPGTQPPIIGLEGALKAPSTVSTVFPDPNEDNEFQEELEKLVNLPLTIIGSNDAGDPIISVPLYGGKHAKQSPTDIVVMDIEQNNWVNALNKDPRTRVAAGFGTLVVQKNQERFMRKAWEQVQKIIEANKRIKATQLYMKVALQYTKKTFSQLPVNTLLSVAKPVLSRIMGSPTTIYQQLQESHLPTAAFSSTFRRLVSPGSNLVKKRLKTRKPFRFDDLVNELNAGKVTAAPPKIIPAGAPTVEKYAALVDPQKQLELIPTIKPQPRFTRRLSDEKETPPPTPGKRGQDSVEAKNFRNALLEINKRLAEKAPEVTRSPFNINNAYAKVQQGIHPHTTFPARLSAFVKFPDYIPIKRPDKIFPAMAYPDIEEPMYKGLTNISSELLLPNLQLIPPNTISLLKTNQPFIESYMVGLNHEMGRELLWREYPTDERGSYFRQFWDVNGIIMPDNDLTPAQLNEAAKDIPPIHTWQRLSALGSHNNRDAEGDAEQLVLVIRGDLLKKYPNTLIFAQKAIAGSTPGEPVIDRNLDDDEFKKHLRFPLYKAAIEPDIQFFGFDLTIEEARGTDPTPPFPDNHGWFFIIQQLPGVPQFGMDITFDAGSDGVSWDDLAWSQLPADTQFIKGNVAPQPDISSDGMVWGKDAANMAFILFQKPNMVAVHAADMLENLTT
jgi:hypothetical protein